MPSFPRALYLTPSVFDVAWRLSARALERSSTGPSTAPTADKTVQAVARVVLALATAFEKRLLNVDSEPFSNRPQGSAALQRSATAGHSG